MKKHNISLVFKIVALSLTLVLLSAFTIQYFSYKTMQNSIKKSMGESALNITRSVISKIDTDQFDALKTADDMKSRYYTDLQQQLNNILHSTGLKYLYTMRKTAEGEYIYVVDGTDMNNEEFCPLGYVETDMTAALKASFDGKEGYEMSSDNEWGNLISAYVPIKNSAGATVGILGADFAADSIVKQIDRARSVMLLFTGLIIILGLLISVSFAYMIVRSLKSLQSKVALVKQGDLTVKIERNSNDEVGKLSSAFQDMLDGMSGMIHNIRNNSEDVLIKIDQVNNSVDDTNKSTAEISKTITDIADGAMEQVESVGKVSGAMEKVFNEIENITKNIEAVSTDSNTALKDTEEAAVRLKDSVKQINLVNDTSETTASIMKQLVNSFNDIITFSDKVTAIASQTNLLALNASIEAATAGEHGKGFAVVAGQIKNLAKESSDASKQIKEMIGSIQIEINNSGIAIENGVLQARNGVSVMSEVEAYLDRLKKSSQKVDLRIKDVAGAIVNIEKDSKSVLETTVKLSDISRDFSAGTQQTAAVTEEQLAIMEEIRSQLGAIKDRMEDLSISVKSFIIDK